MLKKELEALFITRNKKEFTAGLDKLYDKYKNDPKAIKEISACIKSGLKDVGKRLDDIQHEIDVKQKLANVSEIINLSYIAKTYFGKTRQWLYQRVNNNVVGGKTQRLTSAEIATLNKALKEISKNIGSVTIG
ncbi:DUF5053 domain-containing protein [Niabella sp.]|uniref:DUF5053 domain-containing protein n=1 Tax=Niabella sp. TaxID=1962976 RepID=UPI00260AB8D8|nr:DUF5053 domain-containing protein [Niabella sp.]